MSFYSPKYPSDGPPPPYSAEGRQTGSGTDPTYPPPAQPSPSGSSSGSGISGFFKGFTGEDPPDLLNPPPPSFSRPPRRDLPYSPFAPLTIMSAGTTLDHGFPIEPPYTAVQPHPFMIHDIWEEDWTRFLTDIQKAGKLSPMNKIVAAVVPIAMGIRLAGMVISRGIEGRMRKKKSAPATQIVDHWNNYFFWPRGMDISLIHGRHVYTEHDSIPADMARAGYNPVAANDSSDSESEDEGGHGARRGGIGERRAERRARRAERRGRRQEQRETRRNERDAKREPWKLFITYRPPV